MYLGGNSLFTNTGRIGSSRKGCSRGGGSGTDVRSSLGPFYANTPAIKTSGLGINKDIGFSRRNLNGTARRGHKIESGPVSARLVTLTQANADTRTLAVSTAVILSTTGRSCRITTRQLSEHHYLNFDGHEATMMIRTPNPNPFSRMYNSMSSYVPLRSDERSNEEEAYFALSRWELLGFGACLLGAATCFFVAFLTLPWLALKPGKFALAFRFCVLIGPVNQIKHLLSKDRLPFSAAYFGSLGLTLYFSLGSPSYFGALISAIVQIIALLSYIAAYFPGGTQTLRFGGQMALRGAGNLLPI
ncbi:Got1/Sft2-like family domain-containing protein [Rhizoctonia solani AG-1 IA]|uniref:Protein transport protein SFT2 n=1 Tax=Thanatephorus cucumeris (strain AG1-IA) TaxID=983506 RepID=L8WLC5_THACA|nr:Got1/Sft2-like family domain-containing protein [Rhizoctonia solani AG-1 IA]